MTIDVCPACGYPTVGPDLCAFCRPLDGEWMPTPFGGVRMSRQSEPTIHQSHGLPFSSAVDSPAVDRCPSLAQ